MAKEVLQQKVIGAFLGTIVEYYDYSLYVFSASIIGSKFFSSVDHLTNLTNVFAIYAIAYCSKPLGSLIFGRIGDIYGRKIALSVTTIGIAIPTIIIGLVPEYSKIGAWSTIVLVTCRFMQNIFIAGEYDGAAIYVIEHLGQKWKSTASAITRSTGVLGLLLGIGSTNLFNAHIFPDWGWRIPFLLSLPLSLLTLYYRQKLIETPDFKKVQKNKMFVNGLIPLLQKQWRTIIMVVFCAGSFGATYQVSIVFMKQYLPIVLPQTTLIISTFSVLLVACFGFTMPIAGFLADRIGQILVIRCSLYGVLIASSLLFIGIKLEMINLALASSLALACFVAPFNALAHGVIINSFKISDRYRGISIGHTVGSMLMSGSANYICLLFMKYYQLNLFPVVYVVLFSLLGYFIMHSFDRLNKNKI
jgi:MFS transporter, MHS family, proline/betaine transporter